MFALCLNLPLLSAEPNDQPTGATEVLANSTTDLSLNVISDPRDWLKVLISGSDGRIRLSLDVPSGCDFDLYLFDKTALNLGELGKILARSTRGVGTDELIEYTPSYSGAYYVLAKAIRGIGVAPLRVNTLPPVTLTRHRISNTSGVPDTSNPGTTKTLFLRTQTARVTLKALNTGTPTEVIATCTIISPDGTEVITLTHPVSLLEENVARYFSFDWTIPDMAPGGSYSIRGQVVRADYPDIVLADLRVNNAFSVAAPDLAAPEVVVLGSDNPSTAPVTVQWRVQNIGTQNAPSTHARAYLSTDRTLDTSKDYFLGRKAVKALTADESAWIQWDFPLPDFKQSAPISLWCFCVVDSEDDAPAELNESNAYSTPDPNFITPPPVWFAVSVTDWDSGEPISDCGVSWGDYTQFWPAGCGSRDITVTHAGYYTHTSTYAPTCRSESIREVVLQRNDDSAANAMPISSDLVKGRLAAIVDQSDWWVIWPRDAASLRATLLVPESCDFDLLVYSDPTLPPIASSERHFPLGADEEVVVPYSRSAPCYIKISHVAGSGVYELRTTTLTLPDVVAIDTLAETTDVSCGTATWVKRRLQNIGAASAGASHVKAFLSTDKVLDAQDWNLGELPVDPLTVNGEQWVQWNFVMPDFGYDAALPLWLICVVDSRNEVPDEANEQNTFVSDAAVVAAQPPTQFTVAAVDSETGVAIENPVVSWGQYTTFNPVPCGSRTLTVTHEGYYALEELYTPACRQQQIKTVRLRLKDDEPVDARPVLGARSTGLLDSLFDRVDYWVTELREGGLLRVNLSVPDQADFDLSIHSVSDLSPLASSTAHFPLGADEALNVRLTTGQQYLIKVTALSGSGQYELHVQSAQNRPLVLQSIVPREVAGNGDGRIQPGELVAWEVSVRNDDEAPCYKVRGHLSTSDSRLMILRSLTSPSSVPALSSSRLGEPLLMLVPANYTGTPQVTVTVTAEGESPVDATYSLPPCVALAERVVTVINQKGARIAYAEVKDNGTTVGYTDVDGTLHFSSPLGLHTLVAIDSYGRTSDPVSRTIEWAGGSERLDLLILQTLFAAFDATLPATCIAGSDINIALALQVECVESGVIHLSLLDQSGAVLQTTTREVQQPGVVAVTTSLHTRSPESAGPVNMTIEGRFVSSSLGVLPVTVTRNLVAVVVAPPKVVQRVAIVDENGVELSAPLYQHQVGMFRLRVELLAPAEAVQWGNLSLSAVNEARTAFEMPLSKENFRWGEWDASQPQGTLNTVNVTVFTGNAREASATVIECRATPRLFGELALAALTKPLFDLKELHGDGFLKFADDANRNNVLSAIRDDHSSKFVGLKMDGSDPKIDGKIVDLRLKVEWDRRDGGWFWQFLTKNPGDAYHTSIGNKPILHFGYSFAGNLKFHDPIEGQYNLESDMLEVVQRPGGPRWWVLMRTDFDDLQLDGLEKDIPFRGTVPRGYAWRSMVFADPNLIASFEFKPNFESPEAAFEDFRAFMSHLGRKSVPSDVLTSKPKLNLAQQLTKFSRVFKGLARVGTLVEVGGYVYDVREICQSAEEDRYEQFVEVTGPAIGGALFGGLLGSLGGLGGAAVGLACLPGAEVCSSVLAIGGAGALGWWGDQQGRKWGNKLVHHFLLGTSERPIRWESAANATREVLESICTKTRTSGGTRYEGRSSDGEPFTAFIGDCEFTPNTIRFGEGAISSFPALLESAAISIAPDAALLRSIHNNWVVVRSLPGGVLRRSRADNQGDCTAVPYNLEVQTRSGRPGTEVYFPWAISNTGEKPLAYRIDPEESTMPAGWELRCDTSVDRLEPGMSTLSVPRIYISPNASGAESARVSFVVRDMFTGLSLSTNTMIARCDTEAPSLRTAGLSDGMLVSNQLQFQVLAVDESLESLQVLVDGAPKAVNGLLSWSPSESGGSPDGIHRIDVTASDSAGNRTERTFSVNVDSPPVVIINAPREGEVVNTKVFEVRAFISDPSVRNVQLSVNGVAVQGQLVAGDFSAVISLQNGENVLELRASDASGNTSNARVACSYAGAPPRLRVVRSEVTSPDGLALELDGESGVRYLIEFSEDLSVWESAAIVAIDPPAVSTTVFLQNSTGRGFFRARLLR